MTAEQFQSLLKRYREGVCSPDEQKLVEEFYASVEFRRKQPLTASEEAELKNRYWGNVNAHIQSHKPFKKNSRVLWPAIAAAASLVLAITALLYIQSGPGTIMTADKLVTGPEPSRMEEITNN